MEVQMVGPLSGTRVIELQALGPVPFAGMLMASLGAEVIQVRRPSAGVESAQYRFEIMERDRRSIVIDLKRSQGVELMLRLVGTADVLLEGFRPGVAERLGLGPDICEDRNPGLIYGRATGWGRTGPLAHLPGHDINYLAISGVLHAIGRADAPPVPPLSLVGDFGGGGMLLVIGILAALQERARSSRGQVVDAAMVDGICLQAAFMYGALAGGSWSLDRGANILDTGAPFYDTYETSDGRFVAVGAIEPRFWARLVTVAGLPKDWIDRQNDRAEWPAMKAGLRRLFASETRDYWVALLADQEACVSPVLDPVEAQQHPQNLARGVFVTVDGIAQPGPAPRLSRTMGRLRRGPSAPGLDTDAIIRQLGYKEAEQAELRRQGIVI